MLQSISNCSALKFKFSEMTFLEELHIVKAICVTLGYRSQQKCMLRTTEPFSPPSTNDWCIPETRCEETTGISSDIRRTFFKAKEI